MNGTLGIKDPLYTPTQEIAESLLPMGIDVFLICMILFRRDRIQVTEL